MKCHQCNQDSIRVKGGVDEGRNCFFLHIYCDICGLDIEVTGDRCPHLGELFIYNENLENAEKLGRDNYIEGKELEDNPYSLDSDQIVLNRSWESGYNSERESYENEALIISSGKMEEELREKVEGLELDKEYYKDQLLLSRKLKDSIFMYIDKFCCKLLDRKILSIFFGKDVKKFRSNLHKDYSIDNP